MSPVGVVAKRVCAAVAAHEGDDNTPLGPTGRGVKTVMDAIYTLRVNPYNAEILLYKPLRLKFFQFEIIINVLASSFRFI